jgi:hypothetical protein
MSLEVKVFGEAIVKRDVIFPVSQYCLIVVGKSIDVYCLKNANLRGSSHLSSLENLLTSTVPASH